MYFSHIVISQPPCDFHCTLACSGRWPCIALVFLRSSQQLWCAPVVPLIGQGMRLHVLLVMMSLLKSPCQVNVLNVVALCAVHAFIIVDSVMVTRALDTHRIGDA